MLWFTPNNLNSHPGKINLVHSSHGFSEPERSFLFGTFAICLSERQLPFQDDTSKCFHGIQPHSIISVEEARAAVKCQQSLELVMEIPKAGSFDLESGLVIYLHLGVPQERFL
jgi:hypothetical protein